MGYFVTSAKNTMLDALAFDAVSLHTAYPGTTGSNEVTGGAPAYARKTPTVGAASGASRSLSASVVFDVPASSIRWVGFWIAGVFKAASPNGGSPKEFYVDPATDTFYASAHGYADTQTVTFYGDTVPVGLTAGTVYYVVSATTDTFKVAATSGGAAIDITSAGSSGAMVSAITEQVYAAQDTHTISTGAFGLPH